jgi:transcriptional regulator with XRE-family HTH domain
MDRTPHPTKGSVALAARLRKRGAKADLARRLCISQDRVSRWVQGERKPVPKHRADLQKWFRIHWRAWDEPVDQSNGEAA